MTYLLLGIVGVGCLVAGMGIEALLSASHISSLEHDNFLLEIENARLKRRSDA